MLPDAWSTVRVLLYGLAALIAVLGTVTVAQDYQEYEGLGRLGAVFEALSFLVGAGTLTIGADRYIERFVECEARRDTVKRSRKEPLYGNPDDTRYFTGDDRPLPDNLRYRVAVYMGKRKRTEPELLVNEIAKASSVNALIRREALRGNL
jgi:hypothetical protein